MDRVVAYASRTLSMSKRNYPAHKLEFLALKWAMTDHFHESLYGVMFVFIDNNSNVYFDLNQIRHNRLMLGIVWLTTTSSFTTKSASQILKLMLCHVFHGIDKSSDDVFLDCNAVKAIIVGCSLETPLFEAYMGSPIHTKSLHITTISDALTSLENTALGHKTEIIQPAKITHEQWAEEQNVDIHIAEIGDLVKSKKMHQHESSNNDPSALGTL